MQLIDYKCRFGDGMISESQVTQNSSLQFPQVHNNGRDMATLSKMIKEAENGEFCILPFCHTVEGEALGGLINLGDAEHGPRARAYVCESLEDILSLKAIDFNQGRMAEVLSAASILVKEGEEVVLYMSGPFTIMNVLIDPTKVFKAFRKKPDLMAAVFNRLKKDLLDYAHMMKARGVRTISYADSSGGLNILGPKFFEQTMEMFTVDLLKELNQIVGDEGTIILCPKTTLGLISSGRADWGFIDVNPEATYRQACKEVIGQTAFVGETCIKNLGYTVRMGKLRTVSLK